MDTITALQNATDLLKPWTEASSNPETHRLDVVITRGNLALAVKALREAHWGYLSAITGLDHPGTASQTAEDKRWSRLASETEASQPAIHKGNLEVLYHFCEGAAVTTLRVSLPYETPSLPTICNLVPTATLYERELMELFGIEVLGTPNTDRLVLSDDWPKGVYPLRKDFTGLESSSEK
jgi:Ni,Fe-hydrogenase III component G